MRKTILLLLSVLLVVTCVLSLAACNGDCNHEWGEWSTTKNATCVDNGEKVRKCALCEKEDKEAIPALGHDWGEAEVVAAKCGYSGTSTQKCTRCDEVKITNLPPSGSHTWGAWTTLKQATCSQKGERVRYCEVCNKEQKGTIDELDHDWGEAEVVVAPTCGEPGQSIQKCTRCDAKKSLDINPTGEHTWEKDLESDQNQQATCSAKGTEAYKCSVCNATKTEEIDIDPTNHKLSEEIEEKDADCGHDGNTPYKTCEFCGKFFDAATNEEKSWSDIVKPAGGNHEMELDPESPENKAPTCLDYGLIAKKCKVCGYTATETGDPPVSHEYGEWHEPTEPTCAKDGTVGYKQCIYCEHYFDADGKEIGPSEEYIRDGFATGEHSLEQHAYKAPTCLETGMDTYYTCEVCGWFFDENQGLIGEELDNRVIPKLDHEYESWEYASDWQHNATCSLCHLPYLVDCSVGMSFEEGNHIRTCEQCKHSESTLEHTFSDDYARYVGEGKHGFTCVFFGCDATNDVECEVDEETGVCSVCGHVFVRDDEWFVSMKNEDGTFDGTPQSDKFVLTYDHESGEFVLTIKFKAGDVFNIKSGDGIVFDGQTFLMISYAEGVYAPMDLFSEFEFWETGELVVGYDCEVVISYTPGTPGEEGYPAFLSIHVLSADVPETELPEPELPNPDIFIEE